MPTIGIVAEYNPFHTGHAYQIAQTRRAMGEESPVVAVMSGNWVQQANCAVADKWTRAALALLGGVDVVLELPTVWATASAESFARGAVSLLAGSGVVEVLSFGSECGDMKALERVAGGLNHPRYAQKLLQNLASGHPYASARQTAVQALVGREAEILATPNNNLGVEYIRALSTLGRNIRPYTVLRQGAAHNSPNLPEGTASAPFVSATWLRRALTEGRWEEAEYYLGTASRRLLESRGELPSLERLERAMLARVRTMSLGDWEALPDSGAAEGLPRRLERAGRQARSMEEFFALAKTKRYTHARLRRLALWALLGLTISEIPARPPYLRVLGFSQRGEGVLNEMR